MDNLIKIKELIYNRKYRDAINSLRKFINNNKGSLEAIYLLGLCYEKNNMFSDSIKEYERLLEFDQNILAYNRLGEVCIKAGKYILAKKYLKKSLSINNNNSVTLNNLGVSEAYLEREFESIDYFIKAINLKPNYIDPIYNLLEIYEKINDQKKLKSLIQISIKKFPKDNIIKFYKAIFLEKENNYLEAHAIYLKCGFDNKDLNWEIKRLYKLGNTFHFLKDYSSAFNYFKKANQKNLNFIGKNKLSNNEYMKKINLYLNLSKKNLKEKKITISKKEKIKKHFFLIGFPRSGTTLLDTILSSHKNIVVTEEKPIIYNMIKELSFDGDINKLGSKVIEDMRNIYYQNLEQYIDKNDAKNKVIIDKLPLNIIEARIINKIFPESKFILALRHPLDCILSSYMQDFKLNSAMINFLDLNQSAELYNKVMEIWSNYKEISKEKIYQLKYEDLTNDFEKIIKGLINFIDIEWDQKILKFNINAKKRKRIRTPSYTQVVKPIYKLSNYKWLNYEKQLLQIELKVKKWINFYKYN